MKLIISIGLVALGGYVLQSFMPWWGIVVIPVLVGYTMHRKTKMAFASGFLGIFLLWGIHAFNTHISSSGHLGERMAMVFQMPNPYLLIIAGAVIGAIVAGFAGLTGIYLRRALFARP